MRQVTLVGNCQAQAIARVMEAMSDDVIATSLVPTVNTVRRIREGAYDALLSESNLIMFQPGAYMRADGNGNGEFTIHHNGSDPIADLTAHIRSAYPRALTREFPKVVFSAFHPDIDFVRHRSGQRFDGPFGHHSSLVFYGWQQGLSEAQTADLFNERVFKRLGYFDYWETAVASLIAEGNASGLPLDSLIEQWTARGTWMYSFNHPRLFVLADIAGSILAREGIATTITDSVRSVDDALGRQAVFPVYPEIADRLGVEGDYTFTRAQEAAPSVEPVVLNLTEFIEACFASYSRHDRSHLVCRRLMSWRYRQLAGMRRTRPSSRPVGTASNPYSGSADHQFWRRAVEGVAPDDVDPVIRPSIALGRQDRVASAGSCFAQHISRELMRNGFNYYVAEAGEHLSRTEAERRNFGVFSARYGNVYSARQLVQLFDRAYGVFEPSDRAWVRGDGRLIDPFRPSVEPDGFATLTELEYSRSEHLTAVREVFEGLDVFVFTLGLTETWRNRTDGAVYPVAPGIVGGVFDPTQHEFVNATVSEVVSDMTGFIDRLTKVNAAARMILTVSPVPLAATYEDQHVLVATTYSKAVLRVAAEEVCRVRPMCEYFPSYEIITGPQAGGRYLAADRRRVTAAGVAQVMGIFLKHAGVSVDARQFAIELQERQAEMGAVVCDEEMIGPSRPTFTASAF